MIALGESMAMRYAQRAERRMHVEVDDLAGAAILAQISGRLMPHGIIDELRRIGGRAGHLDHREFQPDATYDAAYDPKYIINLALKRCGVLMLECLPPRLRTVIMLRYWHGLFQDEVAQEMAISQTRVSQLEKEACLIISAELEKRGIRSMRHVI